MLHSDASCCRAASDNVEEVVVSDTDVTGLLPSDIKLLDNEALTGSTFWVLLSSNDASWHCKYSIMSSMFRQLVAEALAPSSRLSFFQPPRLQLAELVTVSTELEALTAVRLSMSQAMPVAGGDESFDISLTASFSGATSSLLHTDSQHKTY